MDFFKKEYKYQYEIKLKIIEYIKKFLFFYINFKIKLFSKF